MSDVVNCRDFSTCSSCVRENCWWLVFEDYQESCSPVLAGVPNVHEWFHGPGDCRQFNCVRDKGDLYGLLQILAGGAGGALLGGGLMWSLLQTGYRQIQNANQPTARWRRILNFIVRAFRVVRDVQRRRQDGRLDNEPVVNPNEPADVVRNFRDRVVDIAGLEQVLNNAAEAAVNIDIHDQLRIQEEELRRLQQQIQDRDAQLRQMQLEIFGRQPEVEINPQQVGDHHMDAANNPQENPHEGAELQQQQQVSVLNADQIDAIDPGVAAVAANENEAEENDDDVNGNENQEPNVPAIVLPVINLPSTSGVTPSRIPRRKTTTHALNSDSSSSSEASTVKISGGGGGTIKRRSPIRPTPSAQMLASTRLSQGLPSTPVTTQTLMNARIRRSAADISHKKTVDLIKNKLV